VIVLLVICVILLTLANILLIAVLVTLSRVLNREASKRGLLDAVDLLHRRKKWYA